MNIQNLQQKHFILLAGESKGNYSHENLIKFLTSSLESSLCNYSDGYLLVMGDIVVKRRNAANTDDIALGAITQLAFKNCAPFKNCRTN